MSHELIQELLSRGESLSTVFVRKDPSDSALAEIRASLELMNGGTLLVGVDENGTPGYIPAIKTNEVVEQLKKSTGRLPAIVNAYKIGGHWVATLTITPSEHSPTVFPDLTEQQQRLLLALVRESRLGNSSSEVAAVQTSGKGWHLILSEKNRSGSREMQGEDFSETDLHALSEEGYISLLRKRTHYSLSLKPKSDRAL